MKIWEKILRYPISLCAWLTGSIKSTGKKGKPVMALLMALVMLCGMLPCTALAAGSGVDIGDTFADEFADLTALAAANPSALEVTENAGIITVRLLEDVVGRIEFAIENAYVIFDANGHTFSGGSKNQAITLVHYKGITAELIGNGYYTTGAHNTIFVGLDNTLIIKSATIEGMLNNSGTVKTALQAGYSVYTAQKNGANVYSDTFNTEEKTLTNFPGASDTLTVQQLTSTSFTVSFDANGGVGTMADVNDVSGEYTLPDCSFTAPSGKQFKAWSVGSAEKQPGDKISVSADTTVTALWEDIPVIGYTVSFDRNGGLLGNMASVTNVSGEYTLPANGFTPWSTQYFFGWDVNGVVKQPGDIIIVTEDITIKALWQNKDYGITVDGVKITYTNANDVLGDGTVSYDLATQTLTLDNATINDTVISGPVRSAIYVYSGLSDLTIQLVGNNTISSSVPAGGEKTSHNYAISASSLRFTGTGSLNISAGDAGSFSYGIRADILTVGGECTITIASGSSDFLMCALNYGGTFTADDSTVLASTSGTGAPLAAYGELGMYDSKYVKILPAYNVTVSFDANGGTGTMADETVICAREYTLPECGFSAPDDTQFQAWCVNGNEKAVGDKVYFVEDTTITAVWKNNAHICDIQPVAKVWPTCTEGGKEAYYKCEGCGKFFEDANGAIEIPDINTWGNLTKLGHTEGAAWEKDETHHWHTCTVEDCGVVIESSKEAHKSDKAENKATCQKKAVCDVCGITYGDFARHDWNTTSWEKDATGHWYKCNTAGCSEKEGFAAHTPDHEGNATEEYAIKCSVCYYIIEQQLAHTHVFDKEVVDAQYKASGATCTEPAKYYKSCACGEKGTETFENGSAAGHTEGRKWKSDKDHHWHICTVAGCGAVIDTSKAAHTPDRPEATETDPVKCSVCGYEIAPALGHTHAYGSDWKSDKDNHWNECACGEKANIAAHSDSNKDGKCDVCAYNVGGSVTPAVPNIPQTGDGSMLQMWIALLLVGGFGIVTVSLFGKKKYSAR